MREPVPRPDEKTGADERDRGGLRAAYDAGCFDRERQCHIEQKPHDGLAPRAQSRSKPPGDEPNHRAEDEPVDEGLDAHDENLLRPSKRTHHDQACRIQVSLIDADTAA